MKEKQPQAEIVQQREVVWNKLMEKPRNCDEFLSITTDKTLPSFFRMRALEVLFVPSFNELGYKVNARTRFGNNYFCSEVEDNEIEVLLDLGKNTEEIAFFANKIPEYIQKVESKLEKVEDEMEVLSLLSVRLFYNSITSLLLKKLPKDDGVRLFEYFDVNERGSIDKWNLRPLENLLEDDNLDEYWKFGAVKKLHQEIGKQFIHGSEPENNFYRVFNNYADIVLDTDLPKRLFDQEIHYLLQINKEWGVYPLDKTEEIYYKIGDKAIRREFAKRQLDQFKEKRGSYFLSFFQKKFYKDINQEFANDSEVTKLISGWQADAEKEQEKRRVDLENEDEKRKREIVGFGEIKNMMRKL